MIEIDVDTNYDKLVAEINDRLNELRKKLREKMDEEDQSNKKLREYERLLNE